ncbi:MAG: hypothetical protein N2557_02140 [Hydrogenophilus sp.]|nr:hypothetical protein [Hydrogenophilus sp.]
MKKTLIAAIAPLFLAACAAQTSSPESKPAAPAAPAAPTSGEKKAEAPEPRCFNPNDNKFYKVGETAVIAGVASKCELTGDKKGAIWKAAK